MTVYIEYVLIDNFVIDYMLIKATLITTGIKVEKRRLFLCAFFGAIFALAYPLLNVNQIITIICKVIVGIILVLIATPKLTVKKTWICFLIFLFYTFLLGGALFGLSQLFSINLSSEFCISTIIIPAYLIMKIIKSIIEYIFKKRDISSLIVKLKIIKNGISVDAEGFFDTGNGVYQDGSPVIFCEKELVKPFLNDVKILSEIKKIKIKTVNGESKNLFFKTDKILIYYKNKTNIFYSVGLVISQNCLGSDYNVILHPALMEVKNEQTINQTEKVS